MGSHFTCICESVAPSNVRVLHLQARPSAGKLETAWLELEKASDITKHENLIPYLIGSFSSLIREEEFRKRSGQLC